MTDSAAVLLLLDNIAKDVRAIGVKVDKNTADIAELKAGAGWQKLAKTYLPWILAALGVGGVGGNIIQQRTGGPDVHEIRGAGTAPEAAGPAAGSEAGVPTIHGVHKHPGE